MDTLPTVDQVNVAVSHTGVAINSIKQAWTDWSAIIALVYPIIVQIPAMSKKIQNVPLVGSILNVIAGNWGHAANKP